ncbi:LPXTG-motif cell wall-anchored protein [Leucobacter luti]|uniref:DUF5979 domain-containing protein n=1 Tax=Leucobacter luti TaxID=340320 RepID=UPI00104327CC|nr:DUF5979 domain-containing protein [Leucobacter luti]MCW2287061.1 LPXTG-motif cell wall-anchored protein [Leucobacter luti]TCK41285.1 LPXTG-motif cell wall-anchored protein [Leucobacter luti]
MGTQRTRSSRAWRGIAAALVGLLTLGSAAAAVAAPPYETEATLTAVEFTNETVTSGWEAELSGSWSLPDNPTSPAGFVVDLPDDLQGLTDAFPLLDPSGVAMGQCEVTATQIVCDFDAAYLEAHPYNLSGDFNFWAQVRTTVTEGTETTYVIDGKEVTVIVTPPGGPCTENCSFEGRESSKWGNYDRATDTIMWTVSIGSDVNGAAGGESMRVVDTPGANQEMLTEFQGNTYPVLSYTNELVISGSGVQQPGNWQSVPLDQYTVDGTTVEWTAEAGYYYSIRYVAQVTDGGAAGTYTNSATVTIGGEDQIVGSEVVRQGGGGTGAGDQKGRFSITKAVNWEGPAIEGIDFGGTFTVTTPAGTESAGEFTVTEGNTWTSPSYPTGSTVHIDEILPADPANLDWAAPVLSQNDFAVAGAATTEVTLTNTATVAQGMFSASKIVDGDGAAAIDPDAEFMLDFEYPAGPGFDAGSGTLSLPASGAVVQSPRLPVGAVLTLSERTPGPVNGATWTGATLSSDTVTIGRDDVVNVTVTNTLSTVSGGLIINKHLTGAGAGEFGAQDELAFAVVCTVDRETVFERDVTLQVNGQSTVTSEVLTPIPAGAECTVTETSAGNSDADQRPAPVTVMIPWDPATQLSGTVTASLTNFYSAGSVEVTKTLGGDEIAVQAVQNRVFEILVTCQIEERDSVGSPVRADVYSGTVRIKGGQTKFLGDDGEPRLLPLGTKCFAEETETGGAAKVTIDHDSFENGAEVVRGTPKDLQRLSISAVNTFENAALTVSKKVVGTGTGQPYHFALSCTIPDAGTDGLLADAAYALPAGDAKFTLADGEARTVTVPAGVTCQVTETDVPRSASVSMVDSDASTDGGTQDGLVSAMTGEGNTVQVVNTFTGAPTGSNPSLAITGGQGAVGLGVLGAGLLLIGGALVVLRKRNAAQQNLSKVSE